MTWYLPALDRSRPAHRAASSSWSSRRVLSAVLAATVAVPASLVALAPAQAEEVPVVAPTSLLVGFDPGTTEAAQLAAVEAAGGESTGAVPQLRLRTVSVPGTDVAAVTAALAEDPVVARVEQDRVRAAEAVPDDPGYADQWYLERIGWDAAYGSVSPAGQAVVAVLDTGVAGDDPDLQAALVPGTSVLDGGDGRQDPNGHGTAMARIVAATADNGTGIAGVGYAGVRVMPVTVLGADGTGQDSDIVAGIVHAADHGADVILMSFSNPGYSAALQAAADYAWAEGAVLVAATGNDGTSAVTYPAGAAKVVGVTGTTAEDLLWEGANRGPAAFIGAPAVGIATGSGSVTGTSASAAVVAGAAALVSAASSASNGVVVGRLARTAEAVEGAGNGRVQLDRALADTSDAAVVPVGSVGGATGPVVGPYVAAATAYAVTVTPSSVTAGATATYVFRFTASNSGNSGNNVTLTIPNGWTAPSTGGPGSVGLVAGTCTGAGPLTLTGRTLSVQQNCNSNETFTLTYSNAVAPSTAGPSTFPATLVPAGGPVVTVTAPPTCVPPDVTAQPAPQSVTYGAAASFTAAASGTPTPTVQWQAVPAGGSPADVAGATTASLQLARPIVASSGTGYRAVFTNSCGSVTSSAALLTVARKGLTVTGATAAGKVYDDTVQAQVGYLSASLSGVLSPDVVALDTSAAQATFASAAAGTAKPVTVSGLALSGAAAGNYSLAQPGGLTADITRRPLAVTATGVDRAYDGTTAATVTLSDNRLAGDALVVGYGTASFADKNIGTAKPVSVSGITVTGADALNYTASSTASTTARITALTLVVTATAQSKVYDGTRTAVVSLTDDRRTGDTLVVSSTGAQFADKNVGNAKTVTVSGISLSGSDAGNYAVAPTATTSADITRRALVVSASSVGKVYDGTTAAPVSLGDNRVTGDVLTVAQTGASFGDKNVGTGKTVTVGGISVTGTDAGNYTANTTATTTASITAKAVTGSFTAASKVYDRTTAAAVTGRSLTGTVPGDLVSLTGGTATFATGDAGTAITVALTGAALSGADTGNYSLSSVATATADITPLGITGAFTAEGRVYDGTVAATVSSRSLDGVISPDQVSLAGGTATFTSRTVGTGKTVTLTGATLSGAQAGNYVLLSVAPASATITRLEIDGRFTAADKTYDATTAAVVTSRTLSGVLGADAVVLDGGTATFEDRKIGVDKVVTLTGATLAGADAPNYSLSGVAMTRATIAVRTLTVTVSAQDKVYDGTRAATVSVSGNRVDGDEVVVAFTSAEFSDKNVGDDKTVTVSGISASGADATNYAVATTATGSADIAHRVLVVSASSVGKVYDGTDVAPVSLSDNQVSGDVLTVAHTGASFADKNVGTGKTVTVGGIAVTGTDAGNYTANTTATTTASITAKAVTGSFTAANKVYDRTTDATVTDRSLADTVSGDVVSLTGGTATFGSKDVGTARTVTLTGAGLSGADAGNYALTGVGTTTADITRLAITGSFGAADKVYDATTDATVTGRSLTGVLDGDMVTLVLGSAAFDTRSVGTGKTVTLTGAALAGTNAGNYVLASVADATAAVTTRSITGSFTAANKVYDATESAEVLSQSPNDVLGTDEVTLTGGTATFADKTVGEDKVVTLTGAGLAGADASNYVLSSVGTTTADITRFGITGSFTAASKDYDGLATATVTGTSLSGVLTGDVVTLDGGTASFADASAGTGKVVTLTGASLTGADSGNYTVTVGTTRADIRVRDVTGSFTVRDRDYDGTTDATVRTRTLTGFVEGDDVTLVDGTATFASKTAGIGRPVTLDGATLSGAAAANYRLGRVFDAMATIRPLGINGDFEAADKIYDGSDSAVVLDRYLAGVLGGDTVSLAGGTATFASPSAGTGKTVTLTGASLAGLDAHNYSLTGVATTTADIDRLGITGSFTTDDKVYDGTTFAVVRTRSLDGVVGTDDVSLTGGDAAFETKAVGTGGTVTLTGAFLSGLKSSNYALLSVGTATASITPKPISGSFTADDKTYDATTLAQVRTRTLSGVIGTDAVLLSGGTATFATKNFGENKVVTLTGATLSGADATNYSLTEVATTNATIAVRTLTVTVSAQDKVYDGTTTASVSVSGDPVSGDVVGISFTGAEFSDKNVGDDKSVTVSGISVSGADAGNYAVADSATGSADISPRALVVSATGVGKVYDGSTSAPVSLSDNQVSGDVLTVAHTGASFADKNVGTGKTVTVGGISVTGTDAGNYTANTTATTTADITAKAITGSFTAAIKVYDGGTAAAVTGRSLSGTVSGDVVALTGGTATFDSKNVGTARTVTLTGAGLSGADAGNYTLTGVGTTTADITPLAISGSFAADSKVYDGLTTATVSNRSVAGVLTGDAVTLSGGSASFANASAGTGKTVTLTGATLTGADSGNYTVTVGTTTADITRRDVTGSFTAANRVYDATTQSTVLTRTSGGVLQGDTVTLDGGTAAFLDKTVGTHKTVTLTGATLGGTSAANYRLVTVYDALADISPKAITGSFGAAGKVYDGTTGATVTGRSLSGTVSGDVVALTGGTATFDSKNVGTAKTVTLTGAGLSGADAGNYSLTGVGTTTADITRRPLVVTATGIDRTYDGGVSATVTFTDDRVAGDTLTATGTAVFADKNVGTGKPVTVSGITLTGADAGNYTPNAGASTRASITRRALIVTATAQGKVYDGSTSAVVTLSDDRVSGDLLTTSYAAAAFDAKDAGSRTVGVSGITTDGPDAGNYSANQTATTSGAIARRPLEVTADAKAKQFGAADPALTYQVTAGSLVTGEAVTGSLSRVAGEAVGSYEITQGTVSAGGNYALTYRSAALTIGAWHATGFYAPVDGSQFAPATTPVPPVTLWNTVKGGSTVPLKFNVYTAVGGVERTAVADIKGFGMTKLDCGSIAGTDEIEIVTTGSTSLRYDTTGKQFIQNWKTPSVSSDACYRVRVELADGSSIYAYFRLRK